VKVFSGTRRRQDGLSALRQAGWRLRDRQTGGDYEDFVRGDGEPGLLLVDFALGRFILDKHGQQGSLLTHASEADGDPEFDAVLNAVFEGEMVGRTG
jgi:hypothetical protein